MAHIKTQLSNPVTAFLERVADEKQRQDCLVLLELMEDVTGEKARMWGKSIVGFGDYHYKYDSGREGDACLAGFAPRRGALVLYIMPGFERREKLLMRLGKHRTGKGCLYIKRLADVDLAILRDLIRESIEGMWNR